MKVDRVLVFLLIVLLFGQVIYLLDDLGLISLWNNSDKNRNLSKQSIGHISHVHNDLRQKNSEEMSWFDTQSGSEIHLYDSLLTLSKSAARLKLHNGAEISLSEKTFIQLEPLQTGDGTTKIRLHFQEGNLETKTGSASTNIKAPEFSLDVSSNSNVNVKKLDQGKFDLEVLSGQAHLSVNGQVKKVEAGDVVALSSIGEPQIQTMSRSLQWKNSNLKNGILRQYSHSFPVDVDLVWEGEATELEIYQPTKEITRVIINADSRRLLYAFSEGEFEVRLRGLGEVTSWLKVQMRQVPFLYLARPLPRNRYHTTESVTYSWRKSSEIKSCEVQIQDSLTSGSLFNDDNIKFKIRAAGGSVEATANLSGKYYWTVQPSDEDGFLIPFEEMSPIYFSEELFEPPRLEGPAIRTPALQDSKIELNIQKDEIRKGESSSEREKEKDRTRNKENGDRSWKEEEREKEKEKEKEKERDRKIKKEKEKGKWKGTGTGRETEREREREQGQGPGARRSDGQFKFFKWKRFFSTIVTEASAAESQEGDLVSWDKTKNKNGKKSERNGESEKISLDVEQVFNPKTDSLELRWDLVSGAEYYYIEISEDPEFKKLIVEEKSQRANYVWSKVALSKEGFYWRVAAGATHKMGRFSEPQYVQLSKLKSSKSIIMHKNTNSQQLNTVEPKKGMLIGQSQTLTTAPDAKREVSLNVNKPVEDHALEPSYIRHNLSLCPSFEINRFQDDRIQYNFDGYIQSISYRMQHYRGNDLQYELQIKYQFSKWKSQSGFVNSESQQLTEQRGVVRLEKVFRSNWLLDGHIRQQPYYEKVQLEGLKLTQDVQIGAGFGYRFEHLENVKSGHAKVSTANFEVAGGEKTSFQRIRVSHARTIFTLSKSGSLENEDSKSDGLTVNGKQRINIHFEGDYGLYQMPQGIKGSRQSIGVGLEFSW